jgi:TnsA endonuclease N terminal/TnsA endonuclease C terminal
MAVRKIPKNHIHVTGRHAALKSEGDADFESLLEADHLLLLDHDPSVRKYDVQPVVIPVVGVPRGYVPDALVEFRPDEDGVIANPELREVKSTLDLEKNATKYAPKFEAAQAYCEQRGWSFKIITEKDIRVPRLANVKFVRAYENQEHPPPMVDEVLKRMSAMGPTDSLTLLKSLSSDLDEQLQWLPVIWHLVAKRKIDVDWDLKFGASVQLWPAGSMK